MSLPPYIPGITLAVIGAAGAVLAALETFDPATYAHYSDPQIIRILAVALVIVVAWLCRWIATTLLEVVRANTAALQHHTAVMQEQIKYYQSTAQRAIDAVFHTDEASSHRRDGQA